MSARENEKGGSPAVTWIVRGVVVLLFVIGFIASIKWRGLVGEYERGVALYEGKEYVKAREVLDAVVDSPLSAFRLRGQARRALALCNVEEASDKAEKERTVEGYSRVLQALEDAKEVAGSSEEIEKRIERYTLYRDKMLEAETTAE